MRAILTALLLLYLMDMAAGYYVADHAGEVLQGVADAIQRVNK